MLTSAFDAALARAQQAWPKLEVPAEAFAQFLAERMPPGDAVAGLSALNVTDLYLACACLRGAALALRALEDAHFEMVSAAVAQLRATPSQIDEIKQTLREELFVGLAGGKAALSGYSGRGALGGWLRVMAVRTAMRLLRKEREPVASDSELIRQLPAPQDDPELQHLKTRYRSEFRDALVAAVRTLDHRQRNLLRYQYVEGLTVDDLAALYRAHRATTARWVARAREQLYEETRRLLTERLQVGSSEYESILRLIRSQMHMSLSELFLQESQTSTRALPER